MAVRGDKSIAARDRRRADSLRANLARRKAQARARAREGEAGPDDEDGSDGADGKDSGGTGAPR